MPLEIEKKFLVKNNGWMKNINHNSIYFKEETITQGYINGTSTRLRMVYEGLYEVFSYACLTLKSERKGYTRLEYNFDVDIDKAEDILSNLCAGFIISKKRYSFRENNFDWEIDIFKDENDGLILAELEFKKEVPTRMLNLTDWIGEEVTYDDRYYNHNLAKNPYKKWELK